MQAIIQTTGSKLKSTPIHSVITYADGSSLLTEIGQAVQSEDGTVKLVLSEMPESLELLIRDFDLPKSSRF